MKLFTQRFPELRMRRSVARLMVLIAALSLFAAACGSDDEPDATADTQTSETTQAPVDDATSEDPEGSQDTDGDMDEAAPLRIGLVTDTGKVDDKSFNQSAWEGTQQAAEALGAEANYIETEEAKDYENNINLFIEDGVDVIVTVGFGLAEATIAAAQANPDIDFIGVDQFQGEVLPNLVGLVFPEDRSGFLAGALAGLMTETNIVGAVLGTNLVPPVVAFKEGWENGARYTNPEVETISTYHPGGLDVAFGDPDWGAATARQALDQGADIIFGAGGATGNGALIEIASEEGAYCVGVDTDQWLTVPEAQPCLLTSAMKLITPGVADLIEASAYGAFPGGNHFGDVGLAPFWDHDSDVSDDFKATIEALGAMLASGELSTGYSPGG